MRLMVRALSLAALAAVLALPADGQQPAPTPTPAAPAASAATAPPPVSTAAPPEVAPTPSPADLGLPLPTPIAPTALKIRDIPSITVEKLPSDNPFGKPAEVPAALPPKLVFNDATLPIGFFVSVHMDPTGKPLSVRRDRDPIPSLAAVSLRSILRWTFTPGRRGGQAVETWGAYRVDLEVEIRSPKVAQMAFTPVTPTTAIPKPFDWKTDADWLESRHPAPVEDTSVPIEQVDIAPIPQKTPWTADSFKGPFSVKYWVKVGKTGRIERAIPIEVSDPVLLPYFRRSMGAWVVRPAQSGGVPVESWNELTLGGQVSYSDDIKQIVALRKSIGP
jgi:hypothetical protein